MSETPKNRAGCMTCGDVIESKHVHDFATCSCGAASVDGGSHYLRRAGDPAKIVELHFDADLEAWHER